METKYWVVNLFYQNKQKNKKWSRIGDFCFLPTIRKKQKNDLFLVSECVIYTKKTNG